MATSEMECEYTATEGDWEAWGGSSGDWNAVLDDLGVDGDVWSCPHPAVTTEEDARCAFHLEPGAVPDGVDEASRFRDAILGTDGETGTRTRQFLGATFGGLDVTDTTIDGPETELVFAGATFGGEVVFRDVRIQPEIDARFAEFQRGVVCNGVDLEGPADFGSATFADDADFAGAVFGSGADFRGVVFGTEANFVSTEFEGIADFVSASFGDDANFVTAVFHGDANFVSASFEGVADFVSAEFAGGVNFLSATFDKEANFLSAEFDGEANFLSATFGGKTDFETAEFAGPANFLSATFEGETTFQRAEFYDVATFSSSTYGDGSAADDRVHQTRFEASVTFAGAEFRGGADFSGEADGEHPVQTLFAEPPVFAGATLTDANFAWASLSHSDFTSADLIDATFAQSSMTDANLERARCNRVTLIGCDLRGALLGGTVLADAQIDQDTRFLGPPSADAASPTPAVLARMRTLVHSLHAERELHNPPRCRYDPNYEGDPTPDPNKAKGVYRALEDLAGDSARPRLAAQCFVRRKDVQRDGHSRYSGRWLWESIKRWGMLYGESPRRVLAVGAAVMAFFTIVYPVWGLRDTSAAAAGSGGAPLLSYWTTPLPETLANSGYFSIITFTTLGYGDVQPVSFARLLATVESLTGALLMALLVAVFMRRVGR